MRFEMFRQGVYVFYVLTSVFFVYGGFYLHTAALDSGCSITVR